MSTSPNDLVEWAKRIVSSCPVILDAGAMGRYRGVVVGIDRIQGTRLQVQVCEVGTYPQQGDGHDPGIERHPHEEKEVVSAFPEGVLLDPDPRPFAPYALSLFHALRASRQEAYREEISLFVSWNDAQAYDTGIRLGVLTPVDTADAKWITERAQILERHFDAYQARETAGFAGHVPHGESFDGSSLTPFLLDWMFDRGALLWLADGPTRRGTYPWKRIIKRPPEYLCLETGFLEMDGDTPCVTVTAPPFAGWASIEELFTAPGIDAPSLLAAHRWTLIEKDRTRQEILLALVRRTEDAHEES